MKSIALPLAVLRNCSVLCAAGGDMLLYFSVLLCGLNCTTSIASAPPGPTMNSNALLVSLPDYPQTLRIQTRFLCHIFERKNSYGHWETPSGSRFVFKLKKRKNIFGRRSPNSPPTTKFTCHIFERKISNDHWE